MAKKDKAKDKKGKKGKDLEATSGNITIEYTYNDLPKEFPDVDKLKLPYVREIGVKCAMDKLSQYFDCKDYKFNLVQFWFIDILVDCLWKLQDEFQFPEEHQKEILKWLLYAIDLIRNTELNITKNNLFKIIFNGLTIAEEQIQSGCPLLPSPLTLQNELNNDVLQLSPCVSLTSFKSILSSDSADGDSFLAVKLDDTTEYFKLPKPACIWDEEYLNKKAEEEVEIPANIEDETELLRICKNIYKPNSFVPQRFLPLPNEPYSPTALGNTGYILMEYPNIPLYDKLSCQNCNMEDDYVTRDWNLFLDNNKTTIIKEKKNIFINKTAILVIKQLLQNYFYESFQFTVIKLALRLSHKTITEKFNESWNVPKVMLAEVKKPLLKNYAKFKKDQAKKAKKGNKGKKDKKGKKNNLGKKEKAELAKQKKLEQKLAEELRKIEEKKRTLLPLQESITKDEVKNIFVKTEIELNEAAAAAAAEEEAAAEAAAALTAEAKPAQEKLNESDKK